MSGLTPGTTYYFQVVATNAVGTTDGAILGIVTDGPPTQLAVTTEPPASVAPAASFGLTVGAEDAFGDVTAAFTGTVTVSLASNPDGAALSGTLVVPAVNGVATAGPHASTTAGSYTLRAITMG